MPSKRAAIQATASALGGNHAKARPAASAAARAPRVAGPASCHESSATSAALAAWSATLTSRHAAASAPFSNVLAANDAIVSGRYWFDGGPTPDTKVLPHARGDFVRIRAVEQVQQAVIVAQESTGQRRKIDDDRRQRGQREHERASTRSGQAAQEANGIIGQGPG